MRTPRLYTFDLLMNRLTSKTWCVMHMPHGFEFALLIHRDYGKPKK